jgi:hypothetical protein
MNVPSDLQRFLPYIAVAALAVVGLFLVVRGVGGGGEGSADARSLMQTALEQNPKSGVLDVGMAFTLELATNGRERAPRTSTFRGTGPFVEPTSNDPFALGESDVRIRENELGKTTNTRIVAADGRGYIQARGRWYELNERQARRVFNDTDTGRHEGVFEDGEFDIAAWTRDPRRDGTARVDGVETDRIVGTLDLERFLADLFDDAPSSDPEFWQNASKRGEVELFVGKEDRLIRKVAITGQATAQGPGGVAQVSMRFDIGLREANKPQQISAPRNALPPGAVDRLPASALGAQADAIRGKRSDGGSAGNSGSAGGSGRARRQRNSEAYVNCVQQAADTAALEKCQALLP